MATSKKRVTQDELRRLMNEQKKKCLSNVKKIESPLARYDKDGTLHCIICDSVVRSEAVWGVHLNSKNHKQNILNKIKRKEEKPKLSEPVSNLKRPLGPTPQVPVPPKKIKGILKNSIKLKPKEKLVESGDSSAELKFLGTDDADDSDNEESNISGDLKKDEPEGESTNPDVLPEGFFDDPKLDAKVRNVEYKDPIEEEWLQFQKEIKEETSKAQQIIAEDQEEATTERQIDEIDEQIRNWSRVLNLEKKKEIVNATVTSQRTDKDDEDISGDEEEFEEFLDWRCKKSFEHKVNKSLPV